MIVYGSKMYFKSTVVKAFGNCEYCGEYGQQTSYQGRKFGHLYFIPLIPLGAKSQVLNECPNCDMGAHVPLEELEPRVAALRDQFKEWVVDIQDGKTEITPEGSEEPVNAGILIAGVLKDLYCLNELEGVESISEILMASNLEFENNIVLGRWNEMQGDLATASQKYQAAHAIRPDDPLALFQWGAAEVKQGNAAGAEAAFQKYLAICPNDISAYIELATLYETQNDYANIIKSYDQLYKLNPALLGQKPMAKVYKKACKKSGQPGQFLDQL